MVQGMFMIKDYLNEITGLVYDVGIKDYFLCAYGYNQQLLSRCVLTSKVAESFYLQLTFVLKLLKFESWNLESIWGK